VLVGITRGTTREHVIRATLEAIAYQSRDLVECMETDAGLRPSALRVDGGACRNGFLMQFQADLLGIPVDRPRMLEVTAFGAAALAGLGVGLYQNRAELESVTADGATRFEPQLAIEPRDALYAGWKRAVERSRGWEQP
jgi:glycerol kinase